MIYCKSWGFNCKSCKKNECIDSRGRNIDYLKPIGLKPREIWIKERIKEIDLAIDRYTENTETIPCKWVQERNELIEELKKC